MNRKIFALILVLVSLVSSVNAAEPLGDRVPIDDSISVKLGGVEISFDDVPEDVIILEFSSVLDALSYFDLLEQMESEGKILALSDADIADFYNEETRSVNFSEMGISEDDFVLHKNINQGEDIFEFPEEEINLGENVSALYNGVKSKKYTIGLFQYMTIRAEYTRNSTRFTKINSVTSTFSGITIGNSWTQDTCTKNILSNGKKISVTVYGHFDHYILINTSLTRLGTSTKSYSATWSF